VVARTLPAVAIVAHVADWRRADKWRLVSRLRRIGTYIISAMFSLARQRIVFDAASLALQCVLEAPLKITETARPGDWVNFPQS
jgi:hypothetical protein